MIMDEQELCRKRLMDLSRQAERRNRVTCSHFLNLNEQNIYHSSERMFRTESLAFGGYESAERQMVAFIPDALMFSGDFPIRCLLAEPKHAKYAGELSHRDVLGALMHLGIDRSKIGDIVCSEKKFYIFCEEDIQSFIAENLTKIGRTDMVLTAASDTGGISFSPVFEERPDTVASNRIDCIVARAYRLSRTRASDLIAGERVFIDGRCVTEASQPCPSGAIVSVRGKGRFVFETDQAFSKKGKLKVLFRMYV